IKNLEDFQNIPTIFKDEVFTQAFEKAELANFGQLDLDKYESSLKVYRDLKGVIDTAFDEGKMEGLIEGKMEGKIETAKSLKKIGVSVEIITQATGLSKEEINKL
ncbi:PD-(D/E)XK nuclease family transposase, partial [Flavobacterium covae]|uniref:PD-(D/E)XK nuclease family transposase n=1 Tax=Flavobacterium covae TaxID=2906076 RepID=UPI003398FD7C